MQSETFNSQTPLAAGQSFPASITDWDNVLSYTKYNFKIIANTQCRVTVYQSTPPDSSAATGDLNFYISTVYDYVNENIVRTITFPIETKFIAFRIENVDNTNQTLFDFSVVYK